METFEFFEVGGAVRDSLMGLDSKDVDFSVVAQPDRFRTAAEAFSALEDHIVEQGFKVFESRPAFLTIRAQVPSGHILRKRTKVADFVLARKDGPYGDGRRPEWVKPGTLSDDLFRRDFTVNSLARDVNGQLVDLVGGREDLANKVLRFVGDPRERVSEDGLRVLRCIRFYITTDLHPEAQTWEACTSRFGAEMLRKVSAERLREELNKMFRFDTLLSLRTLGVLPSFTQEAIFRDGLRLDSTFAK